MIREKQPVCRLGELPPLRSSRHGKTTVRIGPCSTPRVQSPANIARRRRILRRQFKPNWGSVTPFVLKSSAQFRPPEPPVVNSPSALADIEEVKVIGGSKSVTRTAEQSEIARYWFENSPRGWNRIAREVAAARQFDVWENARLFALVNLAMADGFIGGFECKYHYNYWRPVTAIRERGDSEWLSYLWTPPVPDYPSTHTVLGAAAATVMARFFNTDLVSFSMTSGAPYPNITRKFWSFSEAARENGASRILAGIHFRTAVNEGYIQGARIGEWVFANALRPANPRPAITVSPVSKGSTTAKINVDGATQGELRYDPISTDGPEAILAFARENYEIGARKRLVTSQPPGLSLDLLPRDFPKCAQPEIFGLQRVQESGWASDFSGNCHGQY